MLLPGTIKNDQELVAFLRQELALQPEKMSIKEQEHVAAGIVGLLVNDLSDDWRKTYSVFNEIFELAANLEWSNTADYEEDWQKLRELIRELDWQVSDIHTIEDFIQYCKDILTEQPQYMYESDQERSAARIVGVCMGETYEVLEQQYPQLVEIFDIASDLEISNVENTTISWRRIKQLVDDLDRQVHAKS